MPKGFRERNRGSMDQIRRAIAVSFAVAGASAWSCGVRAQDATVDATLAQAEGGGAAAGASTTSRNGAVLGRVSSKDSGSALQGAIVELVELRRTETTGADGRYRFLGVAPGDYTLRVRYYGFEIQQTAVSVVGGQTANLPIDLESEVGTVDAATEIVITARRRAEGQAKAINQQRTARAVETVISEELFGQVNDGNIANALQKLPGLSVDTDGSSEIPRYVNIRGISTAFNNVQLDGVRLPTSGTGRGDAYGDTGRGFALDDLPSDAISGVRIIKAPTPDMDADGLGGTINLVTRSAFEEPERKTTFKLGGNYNALREQTDPEAALTFSDVFTVNEGRRLGVSVTGSFYQTNEGFDNRDLDYNPLRPNALINQGLANQPISAGGSNPQPVSPGSVIATQGPGLQDALVPGERPFVSGGTALKEIVSYHEDTEYNTFIIDRDRFGLAAAFDYELDDRTQVYLRPLYNNEKRTNDDRRYHKIMDNDHGDGSGSIGEFNPDDPQDFFLSRRIVEGAMPGPLVRLGADPVRRSTVDFVNENFGRSTLDADGNPRGSVRYNQTFEEEDITLTSLSFGGERQYERSVLDVSANVSRAEKTIDGQTAVFTRNGFAFEYDRSDRFAARDEQFRIINSEYSYLPNVDVNELVVDPSRIDTLRPSTVRSRVEDVTEDRYSLGLDFEREIDFGAETAINGTWKTGFKLGRTEREFDETRVNYALVGPGDAGYTQIPYDSFIRNNEFSVDGQEMPFYFDPRAVIGFAQNAANQSAGLVSVNTSTSERDSILTDYTAEEDTLASYVMATLEAGPLEVIGGVRWEHTRFEATRVATGDNFEGFGSVTDKSDYDNILPGLLANYEITDNLLLRGALTNTFSRPQLVDLINTRNINELDDPVEIEAGNPNLPAIESRNTDISLEWYLRDGFYSAGVFRKEITGFSFEAIDIDENVPEFGGRDVQTSTPLATGNATNQGIELAAYQKLNFLPFPFNGFYSNLSYTWTGSKADYPGRDETELPTRGASEHLFATTLGYEWRRLATAISYRYRSPYIEGLALEDLQGENSFIEDDSFGESEVVDLTFSFRVWGDINLYANVTNLFEETIASRQGYLDTPEDIYFNQRRIAMGFRGSF